MGWRGVLIFLLVAGGIGAVIDNTIVVHPPVVPPGDGTKPSSSPIRNVSYAPAVVEAAVKAQLRDPNSATFGDMFAVGDRKIDTNYSGAVCGSVNAKNGFGGYVGERSFVYLMMSHEVFVDPVSNNVKFVALYNRICAGKHT